MNTNSCPLLSRFPGMSYRRQSAWSYFVFGLFFILPMTSGCSSDSSDDTFYNSARVVDLALEDSTIRVGDGTVLAVNFSFDAGSVFSDHNNVAVVVRLPDGIEFRDGTSEIDGLGGDEGIGAQVIRCGETGESFLVFDMDEFDLDNAANPTGDGDALLTLTVDATKHIDFSTIEAAAEGDGTPLFRCGESFASDEQVSIEVN